MSDPTTDPYDPYGPADDPMTGPLDAPRDDGGWHALNVSHLVMGVAFLGLAAVWAVVAADLVEVGDLRWMLPVPWVLAGLAGLLAIGLNGRGRRPARRARGGR